MTAANPDIRLKVGRSNLIERRWNLSLCFAVAQALCKEVIMAGGRLANGAEKASVVTREQIEHCSHQ